MCVKLPPGDLNIGPSPPHPTSTYTCGVTIAPRVCDGGFRTWMCKIEQFFYFALFDANALSLSKMHPKKKVAIVTLLVCTGELFNFSKQI